MEVRSLSLFEGEGQGEGALEPRGMVMPNLSKYPKLEPNSRSCMFTALPLPDPLPRGGRGNVFDGPLLYFKRR